MPQDDGHQGSDPGIADLAGRLAELRQSADLPGADPRALLDAAFAELDAAIDVLTIWAAGKEGGADGTVSEAAPDAISAERSLLRAVFQHAPAALFVLETDGTIRRANTMAGELIGASPGYATGRPLSTFIDLPSRASVRSQLAAVARTGTTRQAGCKLLTEAGPVDAALTLTRTALPGGRQLLVAAVTAPEKAPALGGAAKQRRDRNAPAKAVHTPDGAVQAMVRRMDLVTSVTRLLLDNSTFSEAVTLQRCARRLAGDVAAWVIVDIERDAELRRQIVIGPQTQEAADLIRRVRAVNPQPDSVPAQVHAERKSVLLAHVADTGLLGAAADRTPLLLLLGATSLLSVPISADGTGYGVLTLIRRSDQGPFEIADLGLAETLGEHLAVAIRVDRMFRHRSTVAETLQGSLLPARLPEVPGLDLSAVYVPAGEGLDVSGDFYDVFAVRDGWGIVVGDVCGKGHEAAAMTAAARHAIRAVAHWNPDPADVLARVNEVMLAGDYEDRFVTAKLAYLRWENRRLRVTLGSSGHPGPIVVRADGRIDVLTGGGLPLGLFPDAAPQTSELELAEGDLLFFYTDGVTDARSSDMGYFEDRLTDDLAGLAGRSAAETARTVQELVSTFSAGELRDDLTILAAKVTSTA